MSMDKANLFEAFTRFDKLVQQFAAEGGHLNDRKKAALDAALELHAQAAAKLKFDPKAAIPDFAPA